MKNIRLGYHKLSLPIVRLTLSYPQAMRKLSEWYVRTSWHLPRIASRTMIQPQCSPPSWPRNLLEKDDPDWPGTIFANLLDNSLQIQTFLGQELLHQKFTPRLTLGMNFWTRSSPPDWPWVWDELLDQEFTPRLTLGTNFWTRSSPPDWPWVWDELLDQEFTTRLTLGTNFWTGSSPPDWLWGRTFGPGVHPQIDNSPPDRLADNLADMQHWQIIWKIFWQIIWEIIWQICSTGR